MKVNQSLANYGAILNKKVVIVTAKADCLIKKTTSLLERNGNNALGFA